MRRILLVLLLFLVLPVVLILSVYLVLFFFPHGHNYDNSKELTAAFKKRTNQKSDTLFVHPMACTECSDLYIDQGELTIPPDVTDWGTHRDIKVCGNFPMDLLDVSDLNFESNVSFKIIGKVIKRYTNSGSDRIPLFYVESWEKFYVDTHGQESKGD